MSSAPIDLPADTRIPQALEMPGLVINGKFLQPGTSRSGVYRVARELLVALDRNIRVDISRPGQQRSSAD